MTTKTPEDGWITWNGGECPVEPDTVVEVRYRSGKPCRFSPNAAKCWNWRHNRAGRRAFSPQTDIIAYRIVRPS